MVGVFAKHREAYGRLDVLVNNAGVGIGAPMEEIQTKQLDMQLGVNLRALIIGTREGLPMLREAGAEHGKALIVNTASIAGKAGPGLALGLRGDQGGGDQLHPGDPQGGRRRRDPVHGAGAGLRRHADDRVRQGPGAGRGDDPARGHRRGGPLPAAHLAATATCRRSSSPGPARGSILPRAGMTRPARLRSGRRLRRPGPRLPGDRARRGRWPARGHEVVVETWEERRERGRGRRARLHRGRGIPDVPAARPRLGRRRHAAEAARALLPLLEEMRPDVVVSDILTLAPALAAERAGVPRATLIPHVYPVRRAGAAVLRGRRCGRRGRRSGAALWRAGAAGCWTSGSSTGARELNEQRARLGPAADRALPRRHQSRAWRWSRPSRSSSTRGAGRPGVEVTGPMTFELPHPDDRAAAGRRAAGAGRAEHRAGLRQPPGADGAGGARRRAGAGRGDDQPRRAARARSRCPPNAVLVDWLSYCQADAGGRRWSICHGGHGTVARALGAGTPVLICPVDRRHERDRDAGRLGRRRALAPLAAVPARRRCAGRRAGCSATRPSQPRAGEIAAWGREQRRRRARRRAGRGAGALGGKP